jgi:isopenicillin-N epimerase
MKKLFLLDPEVTYLNHGSFGACPRPVFEHYQRLQLELEREPVEFLHLDRSLPERLSHVRRRLGAYLGADPDGIVLTPNASTGVNTVARSLRLGPGDEIVASDEEYGGMDRLWRFVAARTGATYVQVPVEQLRETIGPHTRVVFASHITSPTARIFPVEEIVAAAREAGALSIVDGAHAPGQLPLDLDALAAGVYAGNCHKWMCAPKGAGFLSVREDVRELLEPTVVSWDWEDAESFADRHRWQGTRDPSPYLTVPAAIDFMDEHDWPSQQARCRTLAAQARDELAELFGLEPLPGPIAQMAAARIPPCDPVELNRRLFEEHRIEAPCTSLRGEQLIRLSFQAYNDADDLDRVLTALRVLFDVR